MARAFRSLALCCLILGSCSTPASKPTQTQDGVKVPDDVATTRGTGLDSGVTLGPCVSCVVDADCAGQRCVQRDGDSFCTAECSGEGTCPAGNACASATTAEGGSVQVCVPPPGTCTSSAGEADAGPDVDSCPWEKPEDPGCCKCTGSNCQANGCYGGWFCNREKCQCHAPTQVPSCAGGIADVPSDLPLSLSRTVEQLDFAIVGDTRPPTKDGTKYYPAPIVGKIWQGVAAEDPPLPFAVTTGDYVFASAYGPEGAKQLDMYLEQQANFQRPVWHALGNHECTGATNSNCGPGGKDGMTELYQTFLDKMVTPMGVAKPYFSVWYAPKAGNWTAKFVFIAANAWDYPQAAWLAKELAKPSTYTFVVRHESSMATQAPGVQPSQDIIAQHPLTLLIVGHAHTYQYFDGQREVIVGNGGAPLSGNVNYGYVVGRQRPDGAMQFTAFDYKTHGVFQSFALKPDGSKASIP
jgi:hypothetical protein